VRIPFFWECPYLQGLTVQDEGAT